jgi:phosphoglycolate phosphatase
MNHSAVVMFDYDGVIVDSLEVFALNFVAACQENGLAAINNIQEVLTLFEHNVYAGMRRNGVKEETIDKVIKTYEEKQNKHLGELRLFESMAGALEEISRRNKVFIITSNLSNATKTVMHEQGVYCFEDVIGADREKSKIQKITAVTARFPDLPGYYVGDTKGDMLEGRAAQVKTVGVAWGWHSVEQLREGGADFIVNSPQELVALLAR